MERKIEAGAKIEGHVTLESEAFLEGLKKNLFIKVRCNGEEVKGSVEFCTLAGFVIVQDRGEDGQLKIDPLSQTIRTKTLVGAIEAEYFSND
jgi:hypothetical protein